MRFSVIKAIFPQILFEAEGGGGAPAAPATEAPAAPATEAPAGASDGPWYKQAGVADEHHQWLQGKQFADVDTALSSYRSLEGIIGRERLAVPKDAEDQSAYDAIYKTLGRPDSPDKYELPENSKIDGDQWKVFAPIFHEAGVSQNQAAQILSAYEARATELHEAAEVERTNQETAQIAALEKEWGSAHEANTDIASRAFRALGLDEAMSDKIEQALGYDATMKLFHKIGSGMSESRLIQDGRPGDAGAGSTLEGAQNKLDALLNDKEFTERYNNSDPRVRKPAIDQVEEIQKQIAALKGAR